jgi:MYXO-CTERM domain-containing protein
MLFLLVLVSAEATSCGDGDQTTHKLPADQLTLFRRVPPGTTTLLVDAEEARRLEVVSGDTAEPIVDEVPVTVAEVEGNDGEVVFWQTPPLEEDVRYRIAGRSGRTLGLVVAESAVTDVFAPTVLSSGRRRSLPPCASGWSWVELDTLPEGLVVQLQLSADEDFRSRSTFWVRGGRERFDSALASRNWVRARTWNRGPEVSEWSEPTRFGCGCGHGGPDRSWVVSLLGLLLLRRR